MDEVWLHRGMLLEEHPRAMTVLPRRTMVLENHFVAAWNCQLQRKRAEDKETIRRQE